MESEMLSGGVVARAVGRDFGTVRAAEQYAQDYMAHNADVEYVRLFLVSPGSGIAPSHLWDVRPALTFRA